MKAAILDALGTVPRYGDFEEPEPIDGEALIEVSAAAIKPIDRAIAAGTHYGSPKALPVICGMDGVGRLGDGGRVYFNALRRPFGAMAERSPARLVVPVPDNLSDEMAAAVVNPALAAWLPLVWRGRMEAGDNVVVLGATGAAGRMAVRVARLLGANRIVAAGRRQDVLGALGADATVNLTSSEEEIASAFAREAANGIDLIVDYLWGRPAELLIESLMKGDISPARATRPIRLVSVGEMAGSTISLPGAPLRASWLEILGSGTANIPPEKIMSEIVVDILAHAEAGRLGVAIETFPLSQVSVAWQHADANGGRPVLKVG